MDRRITDTTPDAASSPETAPSNWWRDKVNLALVAIAAIAAVGIVVACVGAFALGSSTTVLVGGGIVSISALAWMAFGVYIIVFALIRKANG